MLRRVLSVVVGKLKRYTMAETTTQLAANDVTGEKRLLEEKVTDGAAVKKAKFEAAAPMQGRADRKRKVALLLAYCGAGYYGIQIQKNGNFKTIESELIKALLAAGLITEEHSETPSKMSFQRAARTDKNVSAVGNVISLKMLYEDAVEEKINAQLPPEIRVITCMRTTRGFDSKNHCTARTYRYMLPTYSFAPVEKFITKDYRVPAGIIEKVNEVLKKFVGTRNFHNFTSGRKPNDPSSKRYIISFECGEPFVRDGIEFAVVTIKGQSFMLHHIRKMMGLMISIVRGYCGDEALVKSWGPLKVDIPKAPGTGLFLQELEFAGYNKKFGTDGMHVPLVWDKYQETLDQFKEEHVLKHIAKAEATESVMFQWLATLQYHKFDIIDLKQDMPPDGEKEKDPNWWRTKRLLNQLDKEKQASAAAAEGSITEGSITEESSADADSKTQTGNAGATETTAETKSDQAAEGKADDQTPCQTNLPEDSEAKELPEKEEAGKEAAAS
ncbi:pseudouridylate synthase 1 homolog [Littorina saxatilis]|uniref:pseudouridylate synthase 1 homolog n=1 Tax=Littorina saxatilis TaxID=31220 RepID=UPI0038B52251